MPSLNLSLPAISVLGPGPVPVAANPIAPAAPVVGDDFAAIIANVGAPVLLDGAPVLKPSVGTTLPPERQEIAGDAAPVPPIDVETVMLGSALLPAPAEAPKAPEPDTAAVVDVPTVLPAPDPATGPIACGLQTWELHGASRLILARAVLRPVAPGPIELPTEEVPDFTAIEPDVQSIAPAAPEKTPARDNPALVPPPLPFAPAELAKDLKPETAPASSEPAPSAAAKQVVEFRTSPNGPTAPAPAGNATVSPQPQSQAAIPRSPSAPAQPVHPPVTPAPAALPHGFSLPPELAREVADMVRAATRNPEEPAPVPTAPVDVSDAISGPQATPPVAAPLHTGFAPAHRPAIDTGRAEWMQAMIERIAEMPQADGKREAQIRLRPDALGVVDVKIVERQDRLHVTLNAENPQARQLLADAAPRLHELAEARGLRLGQTGIGGGEQQDRRPASEHQPATPLRARPAAAAAESEPETPGDLIA